MKLNKWTIALAATGVVSLTSAVQAEESHPVNTLLSSTTLSGYVDTSAIWNVGSGKGVNSVTKRFANTGSDRQDGFNLNAVKIQLEKPLDEGTWSAGYKVETLVGPDADAMPGSLGLGKGGLAFKQAYVALRAPVGNGLDFKVGQFDPIIGYEVMDSYANPNFSRSLGFANLEPYGHQGILSTYQFSEVIGASVGVANQSNTGRTSGTPGINAKYTRESMKSCESMKSYMGGIVLKAPESTGWLAGSSLYAGIVKGWEANKNNDPVNYYVGGSLSTPWKELSVGAAYDYLANGSTTAATVVGKAGSSYGNAISLYASYQVTEKLKLNARGEYATSDYGAFLPNIAPGKKDKVIAATLTADYSLFANVVTRAELRWDTAAGGSNLRPFDGQKNDVSVALNVIYKF